MLTVLLDGLAAGMLLFVLAVGLSVTLGLMNFVNLAHGAFGMLGGYVCAAMLNRTPRCQAPLYPRRQSTAGTRQPPRKQNLARNRNRASKALATSYGAPQTMLRKKPAGP